MDISMITSILIAVAFLIGIVKVTKPDVKNVLILLGLAVISFSAPEVITKIEILDTIFNIIFAMMKGFAIGGFTRVGFGLMVGKLTK